jgi:hypothetical protein
MLPFPLSIRIAKQNHNFSLISDVLMFVLTINKVRDVGFSDESVLFLDKVFQKIIDKGTVAQAAAEDDESDDSFSKERKK